MKFSNKIMSVCALLLAVAGCYGLERPEEKGKQVTFRILNASSQTVYGGIYITNAVGKVIPKYFRPPLRIIEPQECIRITINKSLSRKSEYHTLIFAPDETSLNSRVQQNERQLKIASERIPQKYFKFQKESETVNYAIIGSPNFLRIQKRGDSALTNEGCPIEFIQQAQISGAL